MFKWDIGRLHKHVTIALLAHLACEKSKHLGFKLENILNAEPRREKPQHFAYVKTKPQIGFDVTAKLISDFVFATRMIQLLYFLNPKFPVSVHLLCCYSSVCVGHVRKPHCCFSHDAAQRLFLGTSLLDDTISC